MSPSIAPVAEEQPPMDAVEAFSLCHSSLLLSLERFAGLPGLADAARRASAISGQVLSMLDDTMFEHHAQEEQELFTAVLRSARPGAEAERVQALVERLTADHRQIEALWLRLRPQVQALAAGEPADLPADDVQALVDCYRGHAGGEEREFLPLARDILNRDGHHMEALSLALHMRKAHIPIAYI